MNARIGRYEEDTDRARAETTIREDAYTKCEHEVGELKLRKRASTSTYLCDFCAQMTL